MTTPLYRLIYQELRQRIDSGTLARGQTLPSEPKLVQEFNVSLITIRRAIDELVLDGLVERRQGVGSFVRSGGRKVGVGVSTFNSDVAAGRLRIVRTLLQDDLAPAAQEIADKLGVQPGSMLRHLVRLDAEGGVPLSVDEVYVPPALAAAISADIASSPSFVDLWQEKAGLALQRVEYEINVQVPGQADQDMLGIGPDVPLLVTGELVLDARQEPMLWVVTRYRADRCRLLGSYSLLREGA
jgi:GntR family transcriptional regulator